MKTRLIAVSAVLVAVVLSGCATRMQMAFQDDSERLTEKSKPVLLMTATIKNIYKPDYQPRLLVVNVEKPDAKGSEDRLNFTMDEKATVAGGSPNTGNSYLLRLVLEPGRYQIMGLRALAQVFPFNGSFFAPMHSSIEVKGPGVYYLGRVNATVRERKGNEFKAGASIPLIDQAIVGASGGTFDIEIRDDFATDEGAFRAKFPALTGVKIEKAILPPFDRAKAQAWWEAQ
jgi:hypothetical protein